MANISKKGSFIVHHIMVPKRGIALHINAFNFPIWGMLEKIAVNESSVAVYLINENLINPLINTIPIQIKKLNITMGYPVVNSYSYAFLIKLI